MLESGILKAHERTRTKCTKYGTLAKDVNCEESICKLNKSK